MLSFVTGSRAYGTPRPDSDIDLVVLTSREDVDRLRDLADFDPNAQLHGDYREQETLSLRFGKLNLLCCFNQRSFNTWAAGTADLCTPEMRPVDRDTAVAHFRKLRKTARSTQYYLFSSGSPELMNLKQQSDTLQGAMSHRGSTLWDYIVAETTAESGAKEHTRLYRWSDGAWRKLKQPAADPFA